MINHSNCSIDHLSIHHVGNKENDEDLSFSKNELSFNDEDDELAKVLIRYFLSAFQGEEFYNFSFSNGDVELNPLFKYSESIFEKTIPFHENSIKIAQYLYDVALHPNIKGGDLFVVLFSGLRLNDQTTEAIGIFKAENLHSFLTINRSVENTSLDHLDGIHVDKLDKGCLIFNRAKADGYTISIIDKSNRLTEAQYWKDLFLNLSPCNDGFQNTKAFLTIAKNFVTKQLTEEFQVEKTDQIEMLNRSVEYFKANDSFNKEEFEERVFQNENVINSFRSFDNAYREENDISIKDSFEISEQAVKKQSRYFKSILKLDKNFHVYIHGNRNMIERGVEDDGRKYYKIYYENEQ